MSFLAIGFFLYFAPALIASSRRSQSATAIWFTNFFFGWTGVGWLVTLIWALSSTPYPPVDPLSSYPLLPRQALGQPPAWTPPNHPAALLCGACYRPLPETASYCMMCGAGVRHVA